MKSEWLEKALKKIAETPREVLFEQIYGFSEEEKENYKLSHFLMELEGIKEVLISCGGSYSSQYADEDKIQPSKLFNNYLNENFDCYEDKDDEWSNIIFSLPEYNFKVQYIYGQGTLSIYTLI